MSTVGGEDGAVKYAGETVAAGATEILKWEIGASVPAWRRKKKMQHQRKPFRGCHAFDRSPL